MWLNGPEQYEDHYTGKKHKREVEREGVQKFSSVRPVEKTYEDHYTGMKQKKKIDREGVENPSSAQTVGNEKSTRAKAQNPAGNSVLSTTHSSETRSCASDRKLTPTDDNVATVYPAYYDPTAYMFAPYDYTPSLYASPPDSMSSWPEWMQRSYPVLHSYPEMPPSQWFSHE